MPGTVLVSWDKLVNKTVIRLLGANIQAGGEPIIISIINKKLYNMLEVDSNIEKIEQDNKDQGWEWAGIGVSYFF